MVATPTEITGDQILDKSIATADIADQAVDTLQIKDGAILNADINASAAIAFSKLAALTSGNVIVGSAGNVPTSVAMTGDVGIIASGATALAAGACTGAKLGADVVTTTTKLQAGHGSVSNAGGTLAVSFPVAFGAAPKVCVSINSGPATGCTLKTGTILTTGFSVALVDSTGAPVACNGGTTCEFDWIAAYL